MVSRLEQPPKAPFSIRVTLFGMTTVFKFVQHENVPSGIYVTPLPIITDDKEDANSEENVYFP